MTFGPVHLYVLQHATGVGLTGGARIRVTPDGERTTVASDGLTLPTAVVIAPSDRHRGHHHDAKDEDEGAKTTGKSTGSTSRTAGHVWVSEKSFGSGPESTEELRAVKSRC